MIRVDGSEYSEKHSISRLIGSPPGYVGYDAGGQLTEYIRRKPYSIILVDEVEKACREFVTLFLQVLDDGRLTDGQGRVVDFRNTVIIMTSNLGAAFLNEMVDGAVNKGTRDLVMGSIQGHFPPEVRPIPALGLRWTSYLRAIPRSSSTALTRSSFTDRSREGT
jgi:ATP-dependent Clp protease ATP-binding subunit ClpB